ncbi:hypothetical protein FHS74_004332 [Nitrospirillum iridis]|uniref:Uncharacterized protein n=1 Tax=Nitrospirillum iridis TaxID=765888 RepID=A0A7X0EG48_9PROT|nr:hypothetical protein [Nitrospirillum iridis]
MAATALHRAWNAAMVADDRYNVVTIDKVKSLVDIDRAIA